MDLGEKPTILKILTQKEELLITRVTPILHIKYAIGGQHKYSRHTIIFPQDIQTITKILP